MCQEKDQRELKQTLQAQEIVENKPTESRLLENYSGTHWQMRKHPEIQIPWTLLKKKPFLARRSCNQQRQNELLTKLNDGYLENRSFCPNLKKTLKISRVNLKLFFFLFFW